MSPLQRSILKVLAESRAPMLLHQIAAEVSTQTGRPVVAASIPGAFSRSRDWITSSTGRMNEHSLIEISDSGREALTDEHARREAAHPMGPVVEGRFFVFVEEVHVVRRHTMMVRGVADAAEAEAVARRQCDEGMYPQTMSVSIERSFTVRPIRQGHGA